MTLSRLTGGTYRKMRNNHPDKPIMMAEFGKTWDGRQAKWVRKAFEIIKSWPGMKAAIYWNSMNAELGDNHMLTKESMEVYKEIMKDPYFIGAK